MSDDDEDAVADLLAQLPTAAKVPHRSPNV